MVIEIFMQNYLSDKLKCPVLMERPEKAMFPYVILEKTGGGYEEGIYTSTIVLQSYAESLYKAAILNEQVKEAMNDLACMDEVCKSELNTDYNFTDPTMKQYRYQAVYNITHY